MGDGRTYDHVCALRAVTSTDGMTADFYPFEPAFLGCVATRIINEVRGIIATGQRTGNVATAAEIEAIGAATGLPLLVGSGADKSNIADILKRTNGVIVASSLKQGGVWWNPVDVERVREFRAAAQPALGA